MAAPASFRDDGSPGFGWRDAWAFARAFPRIALRARPHLAMTALSRISAVDVRELPRQRFFTASDGGHVAYRTYPGPAALQLVLIHGSACFGDQFHLAAARLSGQGLATIHTLDMRGHGKSSARVDDFRRFSRDVAEFCALLEAQNPGCRIVIGGHSAGGGLVLNVARQAGFERIAGWLLLAPFVGISDPSVRPYFGGWVREFRRLRFILVVAANALGIRRFNDIPLLKFDREVCLHDPRFAREWAFDAIFGFGPGPAHLSRQKIAGAPVLLVSGDRDDCFIAAHYQRALAKLAPQGECRLIEGLGHWDVLVDAQALDLCSNWLRDRFPEADNMGHGNEKDLRHANVGG